MRTMAVDLPLTDVVKRSDVGTVAIHFTTVVWKAFEMLASIKEFRLLERKVQPGDIYR